MTPFPLLPFKPRGVVELAQRIGLDPELLDLLQERGIKTKKDLSDLLGLLGLLASSPSEPPPTTTTSAIEALMGGAPGPTAPVVGPTGEYAPGAAMSGNSSDSGSAGKSAFGTGSHSGSGTGGAGGASHPNPATYRPAFHTYVVVSPDDEPADPEGPDVAARMQIERVAIEYIVRLEPALHTTPTGNPGFDLFEGPDAAHATCFVEVKSRSGPWSGPVALSRDQFLKAQAEGDRFWLYVVENTRDPAATKLHRIQNPVGQARHFCFDPGWQALATPTAGTCI